MSARKPVSFVLAVLCAAVVLLCVGAVEAWCDEAAAPVPDTAQQGRLVDAFMAGKELEQAAVVAMSVDGAVQLERSYGYVDDASAAATGVESAFEWGRCSDLIVWACVMQLVEQGAFDLDDAVEGLLPEGVVLPEGYGRLDVVDLMNHATGLDVSMVGARTSLPDGTMSVAPAFALFSVEPAFAPGSIVAYTPYDALLGAAVVEAASGMPFVDYAREHVLEPLGMDGTYLSVGGSASRLAAQQQPSAQVAALVPGSAGSPEGSLSQSSAGSVLCCFGPVGDLLKLANGVMGVAGQPCAFTQEETAATFFGVTRTYPSIGVARVAHGMFALPLAEGVFGIAATTGSGYSASVYMDRETGLAVAVLVSQSGRADLTQGIPRLLVGRSDAAVENVGTSGNAVWVGTYQDAGSPNHGPAKLLTTWGRVTVGIDDTGALVFDGQAATSLDEGVYSVDAEADQDVYRFHVSLERGGEFSRVDTDSYEVAWSTLAVERGLLVLAVVAWVGSLCYAVACGVALLRRRAGRRKARFQPAVVFLAVATVVAGCVAGFALFQLSEGLPLAALGALLVFEACYVAAAAVVAVWLVVTRWRNDAWTLRQNAACLAVALAALAMVLNLAYWEMLP